MGIEIGSSGCPDVDPDSDADTDTDSDYRAPAQLDARGQTDEGSCHTTASPLLFVR